MQPIESVRRAHGDTQEFVAKLIKCDVRTYQNKEKGISQFKANEMFLLASHYETTVDALFLPTNFVKHEEKKDA